MSNWNKDGDKAFKRALDTIEKNKIDLPIIISRDRPILPCGIQEFYTSNDFSVINKIINTDSTRILGCKKAVITFNKPNNTLLSVGTVCTITEYKNKKNNLYISILAENRCLIQSSYHDENGLLIARIIPIHSPEEKIKDSSEIIILKNSIKDALLQIKSISRLNNQDKITSIIQDIDNGLPIGIIADSCCNPAVSPHASNANLMHALSMLHIQQKAKIVYNILIEEISALEDINYIHHQSEDLESKQQRESSIRKQIRALEDELGNGEKQSDDVLSLVEDAIQTNCIPQSTKKFIRNCISKIKYVQKDSADYSSKLVHLQNLALFPWGKSKISSINLQHSKKILEKYLHGMEPIKERVLEVLAFYSVNSSIPIRPLCIVGGPGTGKTRISEAIADAMQRKFFKISICGITDESILKGTRQTYVGSTYGKIAQSMILTQYDNPVILLDEIDKLDFSKQTNVWSIIMDILDTSHNKEFLDFYFDCNIDLSKIFFIATANSIENIPEPLIDRMDILYTKNYSIKEKEIICKKYIIPKINKSITPAMQCKISDAGVLFIVSNVKHNSIRRLESTIVKIIQKHVKYHILYKNSNQKVSTITKNVANKYMGLQEVIRV